MCGIAAEVEGVEWDVTALATALLPSAAEDDASTPPAAGPGPGSPGLDALLRRRGPDAAGTAVRTGPGGTRVALTATLLALRGGRDRGQRASAAADQSHPHAHLPVPIPDDSRDLLCYNGEIFGGPLAPLAPGTDDGAALAAALTGGGSPVALARTEGPLAALVWRGGKERDEAALWIARDGLGRRSLVVRAGRRRLAVASVDPDAADDDEGSWELPPGLWRLGLGRDDDGDDDGGDGAAGFVVGRRAADGAPVTLGRCGGPTGPPSLWSPLPRARTAADDIALRAALGGAIADRCAPDTLGGEGVEEGRAFPRADGEGESERERGTLPLPPLLPPARVLVPLSGGVDSTLLARLCHESLPPEDSIDLINVCFSGGQSPDRAAALDALEELRVACPGRSWRLLLSDPSLDDVDAAADHIARLLRPRRGGATVMDSNLAMVLWMAAGGEGRLWTAAGEVEGRGGGEGGGGIVISTARVVMLGTGADEILGGCEWEGGLWGGGRGLRGGASTSPSNSAWRPRGLRQRPSSPPSSTPLPPPLPLSPLLPPFHRCAAPGCPPPRRPRGGGS